MKETTTKEQGLRFNSGKPRYDLVHAWSHLQMVNVLTKGANKYAERNWEKGMAWTKVIASLKRHVAAIERGEDYDYDNNCDGCRKSTIGGEWHCTNHTGELHAALIQCNAHFLTAYYKIYPQGDDRPHKYLSPPKIGLDIDEVLADWVGHWTKHHGQDIPTAWNFDRDINQKFELMKDDKEFWLSIPVKTKPEDLHFEPTCYITSRSIPIEWTQQWLDKNGFPAAKVYSIGHGESKVEVAKKSGIDIYVDDRYENFVELNKAGICTFLFDAPHNQRYNVGHKRIKSIKDLQF